jgi:hypothetical protein
MRFLLSAFYLHGPLKSYVLLYNARQSTSVTQCRSPVACARAWLCTYAHVHARVCVCVCVSVDAYAYLAIGNSQPEMHRTEGQFQHA